MKAETSAKGVRRYRWLAWNPLWLFIAAAWITLVIWAMRSKLVEQEQRRRAEIEAGSRRP